MQLWSVKLEKMFLIVLVSDVAFFLRVNFNICAFCTSLSAATYKPNNL